MMLAFPTANCTRHFALESGPEKSQRIVMFLANQARHTAYVRQVLLNQEISYLTQKVPARHNFFLVINDRNTQPEAHRCVRYHAVKLRQQSGVVRHMVF